MAQVLNGWGRGTFGQLAFGEGDLPVNLTAPGAATVAQAIASVGGVTCNTRFN